MRYILILIAALLALFAFLAVLAYGAPDPFAPVPPVPVAGDYDVVVFGGSSAGVAAAVAAGRDGEKVLLLEPSYLIGGLTTGGLTKTDMGRTEAIGGFAKELYNKLYDYYVKTYGPDSAEAHDCNHGYYFETKVAGQMFAKMLADAHVTVRTKERLEAVDYAPGKDQRIASITTRNYATDKQSRWTGKMFIDGTYEGDLMAQAQIPCRIGREARCEFDESMAGVNAGPAEYLGTGDQRVQCYNIRGNLTNLKGVRVPFPKPHHYYPEAAASEVKTIKARNLHSLKEMWNWENWGFIHGHCDSNSGDAVGLNAGYLEADYEGRERIAQRIRDYWLSLWWTLQNDPSLPPEFHADMQNWGVPGDEYLESGHVTPQIYVRVGRRMLGRYFMTQHDLVENRFKPDAICMGNYGLDSHRMEFIHTEKGLVREGDFCGSTDLYEIPYRSLTPYAVPNLLVVAAISSSAVAYSSIRMEPTFMMMGQAGGIAAHLANAHGVSVQDIPVADLQAELKSGPTPIPMNPPYRPVVKLVVKTPPPYKAGQRIEFAIEPVDLRVPLKTVSWNFDGSGAVQSTDASSTWHVWPYATEAHVSLDFIDADGKEGNTQSVDLTIGDPAQAILPVEVPHEQAKLEGHWFGDRGAQMEYYYRMGVVDIAPHGDEPLRPGQTVANQGDGKNRAIFTAKLPRSGRYTVALSFPSTPSQATNVPVTITHSGGETALKIDERTKPPFAYNSLGTYHFDADKPAVVTVTNQGTDGRTAVDGVRWIWVGE